MKFRLLGPWAISNQVIPAGEIIEGDPLTWRGIVVPVPLPFEAQAQDQASYDQMVAWYSPLFADSFLHLIHFAKGIVPQVEGSHDLCI